MFIMQFVISYVGVFFKGLQNQNIVGGKYFAAFGNSYCIATFYIVEVAMVVEKGYLSIIPVATGASLGVVTSMYVYRRFSRS